MSGFSKIINQMKVKPSSSNVVDEKEPPKPGGVVDDLMYILGRGKLMDDAKTALQAINTLSSGDPLPDRELLLEHGVSFLQNLPSDSAFRQQVSESLIGMLWRDLPHPPASSVDPATLYRKPDGSGNNLLIPDLGKSGTAYTRSVPPVRPKPANLPDPGLVFDLLLKRREFRPHPSGLSSLFFSFATCVIHECFSTSPTNSWINDTSSYVDLGTLYGNNWDEQKAVRTFNGKGTLHPDTIASVKLMLMPPAVGALLVLFSRHHNVVADRILQINEKGTYKTTQAEIDALSEEQRSKQDEDVFQKARSVNVGYFAHVVLGEYVACILNTYRADSDWTLDLGAEIKNKDGSHLERGGGNAVSVEFNILYHWHASLSNEHAEWVKALLHKICPGKPIEDITPQDFWQAATKSAELMGKKEPRTWCIHGLERDANGRYSDAALADLIKNATDTPAGAFGARGSPEALRVVEIIGQMQARNQWNVCTMNEFRKYLNLKTFDSFEEWNDDKEIAAAAEQLYGNINDLELYPGLLAETAKPDVPGSGVCVGHTIGRGILDDAVSLIRSDRHLTHDFNVSTLTSWGSAYLKATPGAMGGFLPGLFFTTLPTAFRFNSTYALMPFYTPAAARQILTDLGTVDQYSNERHTSHATIKSIKTRDGCKQAFGDRDTFAVQYNNSIKQITDGRGFMIGFDDHNRHDPPHKYLTEAFHEDNFEANVSKFFSTTIDYQVKKYSLAYPGKVTRQLDVVRDVCNIACVEWVADRLALPIKREETPKGLITIPELRLMMLGLFVFSSFDIIPKAGWMLRETSLKSAEILTKAIEFRLKTSTGWKDTLQDFVSKGTSLEDSEESESFYRALMKSKLPIDQIAGDVIGIHLPIVGNLTQQTALLVDLYLRPEYAKEKKHIEELSKANTKEADKLLLGYIREGMRLAPVVFGIPRVVTKDHVFKDGEETLMFNAGDKVIIGLQKAHLDPVAFPNPEQIDPNRPTDAYILLGSGLHFCFGARIHWAATLASVKSIFSLKNLRRAPGKPGQFARFEQELAGLSTFMYLDNNSAETPGPASLSVLYDADTVDAPVGKKAVGNLSLRQTLKAGSVAMSPNSSGSGALKFESGTGGDKKTDKRNSGFFNSLRRIGSRSGERSRRASESAASGPSAPTSPRSIG